MFLLLCWTWCGVGAASHLSLRGAARAKAKTEKRADERKTVRTSSLTSGVWHKVNAPARLQTRTGEETHPEIKLLSYNYSENGKDGATKFTYTYDEYGYPKEVSASDGSVVKYSYVWKTPGKVWSEKTETFMSGADVVSTSRITREFHSNGSVAKQTDSYGNIEEYDENGYMTKFLDHDGYGRIFVYFPLADEWYDASLDPSNVTEFVVAETSLEQIRKQKINEKWYVMSRSIRYYDTSGEYAGEFNEQYELDGENVVLLYAQGNRTSVTRNDKEVVYVDEIYNQESAKWIPLSKTVYSLNYYDSPWTYSPGAEYCSDSYIYDASVSEWTVSGSETYTWINEKIVKCVAKETYGEYVEYYLAGEAEYEGDRGLTGISYDPNTGDYAYSGYEPGNDKVGIYYICKADGTVIRKFREEHNVWTEWNGTAWVKCTGTIEIAEDTDDSYKIMFDSEGRVTRTDNYENGENCWYELYEYNADGGVLVISFEKNGNGIFYKRYEDYERLNADGSTAEEWYKYFDGNGLATYGHRSVYYPNKISARYQLADQEWGEPEWFKDTDITEAADGTRTEISYTVESKDKFTPTEKRVNRDDDKGHLEEYWIWDEVSDAWVGRYKRVENLQVLDFECIEAEDPKVIKDEYFHCKYPYGEPESRAWSASYQYEWDGDAKDWKLVYSSGCVFDKIDATTLEVNELDSNQKHLVKVDSNRRMIAFDASSWEYDADGRVVKQVESHDNDPVIRTYEYTYGVVTVIGSGIENIENAGVKTVKAVYDLNGVAVSAEEPAAGIYIVKYTDGTTRKLIVK